jgi:hypothetical protein
MNTNVILTNYLHPDSEYLSPKFSLEPIQVIHTADRKKEIFDLCEIGLNVFYWQSARKALRIIQDLKNTKSKSSIRISTTTQSKYLSGCLAQTFPEGIQRVKNGQESWDVFAADFGYENVLLSQESNIYDDAWSFSIDVACRFLSSTEKYYVTSLPKVLGSSFGAMVLTRDDQFFHDTDLSAKDLEKLNHIGGTLISETKQIGQARLSNLDMLFGALGDDFQKTLENYSSTFPGVGVFTYRREFEEVKFKTLLQGHGIRGTSFFGNNAVILPIHQLLSKNDLSYIAEITKHCIEFC